MTFPTEAETRAFAQRLGLDLANLAIVPTTHGHWVVTRKEPKKKPETCSICGEQFPEFSNNAWPINDGRCCAYCDQHVVWLARMALGEVMR